MLDSIPVVLLLTSTCTSCTVVYVQRVYKYMSVHAVCGPNTHVRPVLQWTWRKKTRVQHHEHWDFSPSNYLQATSHHPSVKQRILYNLKYANRKIHLVFLPSKTSMRFSNPHSRSFPVAMSAITPSCWKSGTFVAVCAANNAPMKTHAG